MGTDRAPKSRGGLTIRRALLQRVFPVRVAARLSSGMAYLLILTGQRADDVVELNPAATLSLGSSSEAHIQLPEADVAATHAQVYPAQGSYWLQDLGEGSTYINMDPLANATQVLRAHDVLALGRTFVQFVTERPHAQGGVDRSREIGARDREIEQLRERVARLAAKNGALGGELDRAQVQVEQLRAELEGVRVAENAQEAESALAVLEATRAAEETRPIEDELRTLRGRASDLAAALVMGRSGASGPP